MVGQQQPDGLEARATRCIHELQALKKRAEDARRYHRTTPTKDLLIQITRVVDDHKGSLQAWSTALSKQGHTADPDVVNTVARLLDSLDHSISSASDRLESRLRHRRLYLLGFFKSKRRVLPSRIASLFSWLSRDRLGSRLEGDLTDVGKKIGDLQGQNKILLVGRAEEAGRQSKKRNLPDRSIQPYDAFLQLFENARPETATDMRSAALDLLWDQLPRCTELDGKVGNVEDPGDGLLYNEELVTKARSVLDDLHKAWSAKPDMPTFPHELRDMAKICLVLRGMRQKALLKDFLDNKIVDRHLPMERSRVEEILRMDHAEYTSLFYAEQHRVVPRIWDEGQHLEIEEEEPLPLVGERMLNSGSYGAVMLVRDPFSSARYARKQQLTSAEEHLNNAARKHLEDETKRLKDLRHRHVIHLVKSYRRGRAWGILLRPAAHTDLERLILRYHENKFDTVRNCKHRDWIRPVFMNAFGCLSKGLAYIHGRDIRHRVGYTKFPQS